MLDSKSVKANDSQLKSLTASIEGILATKNDAIDKAIANGIDAFVASATEGVLGTGKKLSFKVGAKRYSQTETGEEKQFFTYGSESGNVLEATLELPKGELVLSLEFLKSISKWSNVGDNIIEGTGKVRAFVSSVMYMTGGERSEHARLEGSSSLRLCLIAATETLSKCDLDETRLSNAVNAELDHLNDLTKGLGEALKLLSDNRRKHSEKISEVYASELAVNEENLKNSLNEGMTPKELEEKFLAVPANVEFYIDSGNFVNKETYFQSCIVRMFNRQDIKKISVKAPKRKNSKFVDVVRTLEINGEERTWTTREERQDIKFSIRAVAAHLTACEMLGGMQVDINF